MSLYLRAFVGTAVTFLILDGLWLSIIARDFYRNQLGDLMRPSLGWSAAAAFYVLYLSGITALAVVPALSRGIVASAAIKGALLGMVAYGTYGLTNLATLRGWPLGMTLVDIAWGTVLTGAAASAGYFAAQARS